MINSENDKILNYDLPDEKTSERFAHQLALCLTSPLVITFSGEIGSGKTTIIRAMLKSLGVQSAIKSPTFSLVESYLCDKPRPTVSTAVGGQTRFDDVSVHHFDLYRIHSEDELEYLGFRDYFSPQSICCIEWAERAGKPLPAVDIRFKLNIKGTGRELHGTALSVAGKRILACLAGE